MAIAYSVKTIPGMYLIEELVAMHLYLAIPIHSSILPYMNTLNTPAHAIQYIKNYC